ncbi:MAG: glycosyltransferase family 39 protein [Chloroflexi bacterium]|nr:glycosyltransferase family 39 protein [Chloroflexota bacterium]
MHTALTAVRAHWPLALTVALFALVATAFSVTTPLFEGPDEPAHFAYVLHLAQGRGLPLLFGPDAAGIETFQPPLYYLIAAPLVSWANPSDLDALLARNPHATNDALALTNRNLFVHTTREAFPYGGMALAVHLVRLLGVLFGAGVLVMTYALARELFPREWALAYGAAAFVAFVPQFGFTSGLVTNDIAATFITTLGLWYTPRLVRRMPAVTWRQFAALGVLLGLAPLTKESGLALWPCTALALAVPALRRRDLRLLLRAGLISGAAALLVSGWWFVVRRLTLGFWFGNPASAGAGELMTLDGFLQQWNEIEISFWGLFGWTNVPLPQPVYDGLRLLVLAGLAGLVVAAVARRRSRAEWIALGALAGWGAVVFIAYVRWLSATFQAHGRLLFPALPALAIIVCAGLAAWWPRRAGALLFAVNAALCGLSLWSALVVVPAAYPSPHWVPESVWAQAPGRAPANLSGQVELLGHELGVSRANGGPLLNVTAYWRATVPLDIDYTVTVQVFDENGQRIGHLDTYPDNGLALTRDWRPGDVLADRYPVEIDTGGRTVNATVVIGMYDLKTGKGLPVVYADGRRTARATLGQITIAP